MLPNKRDERILILAPVGQDAPAMATVLNCQGLATGICGGAVEACLQIDAGAGALLLAEEALDLPQAPDLLQTLKAQPPWSELPLIILTTGGESRRARLLDLAASAAGSVMLLERPMGSATLVRSVQVALRSRRRQYQVRDLIEEQRLKQQELEAAQQALSNSERLLRAVTSGARVGLVVVNGCYEYLFANEAYAEVLALPKGNIVGRRVSDVMAPGWDQIQPRLDRALAGEQVEFELALPPAQGRDQPLYLEVTYQPHHDGAGKPAVVVVVVDITGRKRAEERQRKLYKLVQWVNQALSPDQIYEAALDAICRCVDADRATILFDNPHGTTRFQARPSHSVQYCRDVETHSPWPGGEPDPQPVCIGNKVKVEGDLRKIMERDGIGALGFIPIAYEGKLLGRFILYYLQPHPFTADELRLAQAIASQVGFAVQRHRSQEELEQLVRERTAKLQETVGELEAFSYSIAHDMRAPLRAMQGFSRVLQDEYGPQIDESGNEYLRRIGASASRLDKLIQDVLNYSKIVRSELDLEPVDAREFIKEIVESYPNLQTHQSEIQIEGTIPTVLANPALLTQVVSNLLGNAVKFVEPGLAPRVRIKAKIVPEGMVQISFEDFGIGIRKEAQERVFMMFQRLNPPGRYEGTGIGLTIVRKAVERMGGRVGLESEPGKGSKFWVQLKQAAEA